VRSSWASMFPFTAWDSFSSCSVGVLNVAASWTSASGRFLFCARARTLIRCLATSRLRMVDGVSSSLERLGSCPPARTPLHISSLIQTFRKEKRPNSICLVSTPSNIGCNSTEEIAPLVFFCMQNSSISDLAMQRPSNFARMWIHSRPSTLSDWGQQAKRLDRSLGAYTPAPSTPSSMGALVQHPDLLPSRLGWIGCLFSGKTSSLDAFSSYSRQRGCPAVPCRTTGKLEAATPRSSRTRGAFPSGNHHFQQVESDLSRDGLNPSRIPL
jgi:hypothetical protein